MADKVDTKLAASLKQARQAPQRFAFVAKGAAEGKLLLGKKPVPAPAVAEARKEVGGGLVFRGRCLGEDGNLAALDAVLAEGGRTDDAYQTRVNPLSRA